MTPTFLGVDFSGGANAGRKIWLACASSAGDRLRIEACFRAEVLPGSGRTLARCLPALRGFLAAQTGSVIGLDFPFTLPAVLLEGCETWETFVTGFVDRFADAEAFRRWSMAAAGGRELRRRCELASRTPFCAWNLRLYRQTFAGIAGVLAPLVAKDAVSVVPLQAPIHGRPILAEICPASTLKRRGLYRPYKGREPERRAARAAILDALQSELAVAPAIAAILLDDAEGDALDSALAALAASRIDLASPPVPASDLEGFVYC
jgi:hypothetical protein